MSAPIRSTPTAIVPALDRLVSEALSTPVLTVDDLLDNLVEHLELDCVKQDLKVKKILGCAYNELSSLCGLTPLSDKELSFFNSLKRLVDNECKIRPEMLEQLVNSTVVISVNALPPHPKVLFEKHKNYRVKIVGDKDHPDGWSLTAPCYQPKDRRCASTTYASVFESQRCLWKIFSEDYGKTYKVALASNLHGQKGWALAFDRSNKRDVRDESSRYIHIQSPKQRGQEYAWHIQKVNGGVYFITPASEDGSTVELCLIAHRYYAKDKRTLQSTYVAVHCKDRSLWKIEEDLNVT